MIPLLLAAALAGPAVHQGGFEVRVADAAHLSRSVRQIAKAAHAEGRGVVVDFGAPWCEACRFLDHVIDEASHDPIAKKWVLVHVDVDHLPDGPALGVRFDTIPFLVRVDAKGRTQKALDGGRVLDHSLAGSVAALEHFLGA